MEMNFLSVEDSHFPGEYSWNCRGKLFTFDTPKVMGIVNCTPDSFFDKSRTTTADDITQLIEKHINEGADLIDIGGYSTRPGAAEVSADEEWQRIAPALEFVKKNHPEIIVSIDTFRSDIVRRACNAGADVINDVSAGLLDENMYFEVAYQKVPLILMHMKGSSIQQMMADTHYDHLMSEVIRHLSERVGKAREAGILDVAVDPGFGFSKTLEQNYAMIRELQHFHVLEVPLLVGISRKSMICKALNVDPEDALNGTTALHAVALQKGAHILRVHDVKAAKEAIELNRLLMHSGM